MANQKIMFNPQVISHFKLLTDNLDIKRLAETASNNNDHQFYEDDVEAEIDNILSYMRRGFILESDSTMLMYDLLTINDGIEEQAPIIQQKRYGTFLKKIQRWY